MESVAVDCDEAGKTLVLQNYTLRQRNHLHTPTTDGVGEKVTVGTISQELTPTPQRCCATRVRASGEVEI